MALKFTKLSFNLIDLKLSQLQYNLFYPTNPIGIDIFVFNSKTAFLFNYFTHSSEDTGGKRRKYERAL